MTLDQVKPKNIGAWVIGILMVLVPIQYFADPLMGMAALRISQAQVFQVMSIVLFAIFILNNIYLSLFLLWSLFLYAYYGFPTPAGVIVISILGSCLIYEATYRVVNKDNFKIILNFMIGFTILNLVYMLMQQFGWELLYEEFTRPGYQNQILGFMGLKAIMGMFVAMALPFCAYRFPKLSLLLFVPIYTSECSCAMGAAIVSYLWQLWHISRRWFYIASLLMCLGGVAYAIHDSHAGMFTDRFKMWRVVLRDAVQRPIFGYGPDSFRCVAPHKQFMYWKNVRTTETFKIDVRDTVEYQNTGNYDLVKYGKYMQKGDTLDPWDNPHNEFIMLFYEFGIFPIILLGFLIWNMSLKFDKYNSYLIPLAGFFLGLLVMSVGQFPFHLARIGIYIPIFLACYYKLAEERELYA